MNKSQWLQNHTFCKQTKSFFQMDVEEKTVVNGNGQIT